MRFRVLVILVLLFILSCSSSFTPSMNKHIVRNYVQAQSSSPSGRYLPGFIYDPVNSRIMMFGGGQGDDVFNDTWIFNYATSTWVELMLNPSPFQRSSTVMSYDSADEVIILFGGHNGSGWASDTWIFDCNTETWSEVSPALSPPGRGSHAMVYDSKNDRTLLFSGYGSIGPEVADTWAYDYSTNTWDEMHPLISPGPRYGAGCVFDEVNETMIIFGGNSHGHYSDTWRYNYVTDNWIEFSPTDNPGALKWSVMTYDSVNQKSILFGGDIDYPIVANNTWCFDSGNGQWEELEPNFEPSKREAFGFTYDPLNEKAILFGGTEGANEFYNDTWAYDYETNTWAELGSVDDTTTAGLDPIVLVSLGLFGTAVLIAVMHVFLKSRNPSAV